MQNFPLTDVTYSSTPFPHSEIDGLWDPDFLNTVRTEVEDQSVWCGEKNFRATQSKRWLQDWEKFGQATSQLLTFLSTPVFLEQLEKHTGEGSLIPDPFLEGGGIHSTGVGGFLKMHTDFTWYPRLRLYRRLNLLIYLNKDWAPSFGGSLELATLSKGGLATHKAIPPIFNRTVIFTTTKDSFHGHPDPLTCPAERRRNSIAVYYYVANRPKGAKLHRGHKTDYRGRDGNNLKGNVATRLAKKITNLFN